MARNRQQTENRIREAALALLQRGGFENWGVNSIAREAGVDKVLLYRYFNSVDGLLAELIQATRFWPDPDSLPEQSPEAFISATLEAMQAQSHAQALLAHPSARGPISDIRRKFSGDLQSWLGGLRARCTGSIANDQLERLPALIHFQVSTGSQNLSPRDLWQQVSPPLVWGRIDIAENTEELPPELL